jgi:hypothetical protein
MKNKLCFVLLGVSTLLGCRHTARLYPVQGPLSSLQPVPVLNARVTGAWKAGDFSVVLNDGELCKGRWAEVPRPGSGKAPSSVPTTNEMATAWDVVYGPGFYTSHVLGARLAQAVLTGNQGTTLSVEMYRPQNDVSPSAIRGVARDNKENIYKLAF